MSIVNHDSLTNSLESYLKSELDKVYDAEKQKLIDSFEAERDRIIAAAALRITDYMRVQDVGRELIITIQKVSKDAK